MNNKKLLVFFSFFLGILLAYIYFVFLKQPIGSPYYFYRNRLGEVFIDDSEGGLFIATIPEFKKIKVDKNSFEVLEEDSGFSSNYARDKNFVYWEENIIEGADTNSFKLFTWGLAKDANSYYMNGVPLLDYILSIDSTVDIKNNSEIVVVEYNPTRYLKIKGTSGLYTIYITGEKRVEKN
ncbi:DKNYY domain-containing protein [Patescibacteria group bacterium]|nr:DKNYY domain-containing protein [Patescibacteria group bacterium]